MEDVKIISTITGQKEDEIKKGIEKDKKIIELTHELLLEIRKVSETDKIFISTMVASLSTILMSCPKETRMFILTAMFKDEVDGKSEKIEEQIKKFKDESHKP